MFGINHWLMIFQNYPTITCCSSIYMMLMHKSHAVILNTTNVVARKVSAKKSRPERNSNLDLCDAGALLYQLNPHSKYMTSMFQHHIYRSISIIYGLIIDSHNDYLPFGLIYQLFEHCTGNAELRVRIPFRPEFFIPFLLLHK